MYNRSISKQALRRLPTYLTFLKSLPDNYGLHISAATIAAALGQNEVQVRKDLALACSVGRPKTGYLINELIISLERFLGYNGVTRAIIVGVGSLGSTLLGYREFVNYGLQVVAAFDNDPAVIGREVHGKKVMSTDELPEFCKNNPVQIGIITVPQKAAQSVCDLLTDAGLKAIWNFAPIGLSPHENVFIHNENVASSLALLTHHLAVLEEDERLRNK